MDNRAERIYNLMYGAYDLSKTDVEESHIVKNMIMDDDACREASEREYAARIRILDRLTGGKDDDDMDILVDAHYEVEKRLVSKMYAYATYFQQQDLLRDIFRLVHHHRQVVHNVNDYTVQATYEGEAGGLMAAAVLLTHKELDEVEEMYQNYIKSEPD